MIELVFFVFIFLLAFALVLLIVRQHKKLDSSFKECEEEVNKVKKNIQKQIAELKQAIRKGKK